MQIIDRSGQQLDLWGYERASMVIAWAFDPRDVVQLLFARLELRPAELSREFRAPQRIEPVKLPGKLKRWVYAGAVDMSAQDAIGWYERSLAGEWSVPAQLGDGSEPPPRHRPLGPALVEPVWPHFNLFARGHAALPCVPSSGQCPRTHHRLSEAPHPANPAAWSEAHRKRASEVLAPIVGFELSHHPHLWESVRLILPNPMLRSVRTSLVGTNPNEALGISLFLRRGASLSDLRVRAWEDRDSLMHPLAEFTPSDSRVLIRAAGIREATAVSVDSARLGPLYVADPLPFLTSVGLTAELSTTQRKVTASRPGKDPVQYSVTVQGDQLPIQIGPSKQATTVDVLRRVRLAAENRHGAKLHEEIWFAREVDTAQARLRELVRLASRRVWVIDSYFGAADAAVLLPAVRALNAEVRVLTSLDGLKAEKTRSPEVEGLEPTIARLIAELKMQPIKVSAMKALGEIHDRFIVVDDRVYLLGSSINDYGQRGTMLVRLRSTVEQVVSAIEAAWKNALPLCNAD